jgi:hypothetical protein
MVLEDGFLTLGNIFAMPAGTIDSWILGYRQDFSELRNLAGTFSSYSQDFDSLIDQYLELGLVPNIDMDIFRKEFKSDLSDFLDLYMV